MHATRPDHHNLDNCMYVCSSVFWTYLNEEETNISILSFFLCGVVQKTLVHCSIIGYSQHQKMIIYHQMRFPVTYVFQYIYTIVCSVGNSCM